MLEPPVVPLPDLAARVPDGASVTVHKGDEPDVPMALAMALVRRGVRGLEDELGVELEGRHGVVGCVWWAREVGA